MAVLDRLLDFVSLISGTPFQRTVAAIKHTKSNCSPFHDTGVTGRKLAPVRKYASEAAQHRVLRQTLADTAVFFFASSVMGAL